MMLLFSSFIGYLVCACLLKLRRDYTPRQMICNGHQYQEPDLGDSEEMQIWQDPP